MYNEKIEDLISAALADGVLTEKEKQILFKRAQDEGIDLDEFEMVLDARLVELGKAEKEKAEKSAPKSEKYGDVRKCPACGAMVPALVGACPECGYEFGNIQANLSSQKLSNMIMKLSKEKNSGKLIAQTISSFPVPNTKSDLFEFITSLQSKITMESADDFSNSDLLKAYQSKLGECIKKAKIVFSNDPVLKQLLAERAEEVKEHNKKAKRKRLVGIILTVALEVGLPILIFGVLEWGLLWKIVVEFFAFPIGLYPALIGFGTFGGDSTIWKY